MLVMRCSTVQYSRPSSSFVCRWRRSATQV